MHGQYTYACYMHNSSCSRGCLPDARGIRGLQRPRQEPAPSNGAGSGRIDWAPSGAEGGGGRARSGRLWKRAMDGGWLATGAATRSAAASWGAGLPAPSSPCSSPAGACGGVARGQGRLRSGVPGGHRAPLDARDARRPRARGAAARARPRPDAPHDPAERRDHRRSRRLHAAPVAVPLHRDDPPGGVPRLHRRRGGQARLLRSAPGGPRHRPDRGGRRGPRRPLPGRGRRPRATRAPDRRGRRAGVAGASARGLRAEAERGDDGRDVAGPASRGRRARGGHDRLPHRRRPPRRGAGAGPRVAARLHDPQGEQSRGPRGGARRAAVGAGGARPGARRSDRRDPRLAATSTSCRSSRAASPRGTATACSPSATPPT